MMDKEIKEHVKNVEDTIKITRAMQVIATTKIYSRQTYRENAREYLSMLEKVASMAMTYDKASGKWFNQAHGSASAYIVIAGDKGLCGDYNHVLLSFADEQIDKMGGMAKLYLIGHMGIPFFENSGLDMNTKYVYHQLTPEPVDTADMAETLVQEFLNGGFKDLHVIYTEIGKYGETYPVCKQILPLEYTPQEDKTLKVGNDTTDGIYKELVLAKIYYAVMTASLAVNYKRMAAMKQATTNGEEMIEKLRLQLNKSRQERITNELIDAIAVTFGKRV